MQVFDPIHGTVTFRGCAERVLIRLLSLPIIQRLRFLKQNNFASYRFLGADHTRYAHALGTTEVARRLVRRLQSENIWKNFDFHKMADAYPNAFSGQIPHSEVLETHVLAAALLQDVGELPYQFVAKKYFKLNKSALGDLSTKIQMGQLLGSSKIVLGLAALFSSQELKTIPELDWDLLTHLVAGQLFVGKNKPHPLDHIISLLDSEVDADRLDYVYRDAYHTVGFKGSPESVIMSLLYVDDNGPVFSDSGPITEFFSLRGHLWSHVYSNSRVRMRVTLLHEVLNSIHAQSDPVRPGRAYDELKKRNISFHLNIQEFISLDDQTLWTALSAIHENNIAKQSLSSRGQKALELLLSHDDDYQSQWIKAPDQQVDVSNSVELPNNFFFDTHEELFEHKLYSPGSVRVKSAEWERVVRDGIMELERCGTVFDGFFQGGTQGTIPSRVQVFLPPVKERRGVSWNEIDKTLQSGALYHVLLNKTRASDIDIPSDTWGLAGFSGKKIFVSFRWANVNCVDEILRYLYAKKRRYKALRRAFEGIGGTTHKNSVTVVQNSEAALVLISAEYANAYMTLPTGNIHAEVIAMTQKKATHWGSFPIVFVSMDSWELFKDALPWQSLGFDSVPMVGAPIRNAGPALIADAMNAALERIESGG